MPRAWTGRCGASSPARQQELHPTAAFNPRGRTRQAPAEYLARSLAHQCRIPAWDKAWPGPTARRQQTTRKAALLLAAGSGSVDQMLIPGLGTALAVQESLCGGLSAERGMVGLGPGCGSLPTPRGAGGRSRLLRGSTVNNAGRHPLAGMHHVAPGAEAVPSANSEMWTLPALLPE